MKFATAVSLFALMLAGCASVTLDAEGCRNADWVKIGHRDGVSGNESRLQQHAAQCAPYGVKPDEAKYASGLAEGHSDHAVVTAPRRISLF